MAQEEPMDVDAIESDFDNKENAFHYNNVLPRTPCTEKGYEELDVSELNMKLRYSITPASSPMSKSFTGSGLDNRNRNPEDYINNTLAAENGNLTRSLNSTLTKTETVSKSKVLPLQTLSADSFVDSNRNTSIHRLLDPTDNNITISVNNANDPDENLSLPSTCSSVPDTPEATTPTKEIPKPDSSPIIRGLKSVLSMFRPSQSPILPVDEMPTKPEVLTPTHLNKTEVEPVQVSTPVAVSKMDANSSKRSSPLKESLVFNDDLERELQWKDETTILFKEERIPVHKLFFQHPITEFSAVPKTLNATVEHMDIACDESIVQHKSNTSNEPSNQVVTGESDNEFLDCETTFTKNEACASNYKKLEMDIEIQMAGNVTGHLLNNSEISGEIISECKDILKNSVSSTPADITKDIYETPTLVSDLTTNMNINTININEVTMNFLNSESNGCNELPDTGDANLQDELKANKKLQSEDLNVTVSVNEQVTKHDALIEPTEAKPISKSNVINHIAFNVNHIGKEMRGLGHQICCNVDNLPDICAELLNNINNSKDSGSETLLTMETKEKVAINDMAVTVKDRNIITEYSASINEPINIQSANLTDNLSDINKSNMINKLESNAVLLTSTNHETLVVDTGIESANLTDNLSDINKSNMINKLESNAVLLTSTNHETLVVDTGIPVTDKDCNKFSNVRGILDEDHKINADNLVTQTAKNEKDIVRETDSEISLNNMNLNDAANILSNVEIMLDNNHKLLEDLPSIQTIKSEDDIPITIASLPLLKDFSNLTNQTSVQSGLNAQFDAISVYSITNFPKTNMTDELNDVQNEDILETKKESKSLEMCSKTNQQPDNMQNCGVIANTDSVVNNGSDHNREFFELAIGTDTVSSKLPSEIPLPAEDDTEQNILETNGMYKKDCDIQDMNTFQTIGKDTTINVENKLFADCIKCHQGTIILNPIEETSTVDSSKENSIQIIDNKVSACKEINDTQTCIIQSDHVSMSEAETIDMNINIKDVSENSQNKVDQKVHTNTEEISCITKFKLMNCEKDDDINDVGKFEDTKQTNANNNNGEVLPVEIDEEIITSANNSPYVSVTDLDIVAEKILEDPLEKVKNSANTKFASSPPISPKIVSKGYNFNFDEIDDPFATKTKIRVSPTPDTPNQPLVTVPKEAKTLQEVAKKVNRRKSQPERKRPIQKKNINTTFSDKLNTSNITDKDINPAMNISKDNVLDNISIEFAKENVPERKTENNVTSNARDDEIYQKVNDTLNSQTSSVDQVTSAPNVEIQHTEEEIKSNDQTLVISNEKSTSSSEQYFSLGTSSGESSGLMNRSKNVFNLPEIDDVNFNPFVPKSKMHMSPPPIRKPLCSSEITNDVPKSIIVQEQSDNNISINKDVEPKFNKKNDNDSSPIDEKSNNAICSSKNSSDINTTVREILTEDEDTIEGPFLEVDEDLKDAQKLIGSDSQANMMNYEELPQQERDENLDNGELFIDADAFEFLLNQNKSTTVLDSGKESLFLKFDPLFAKRVSSDGILAALSKVQKRQSTPKKVTKPTQNDFIGIEKSTAGPSNVNENCDSVGEFNEDLPSTIIKPMMVVNPAVSSITQKKAVTPKLNRRSLTFTSPAMAVIDRLLSLSGNSSHLEHDASISQIGREQSETDLAITQLRELLAEKEINVHSLRSESKELKDRLLALEVQVRGLETESAERLAKINDLNDRLVEKTKMNKSMAIVVEEYERTIASLIAETEQDKKRNAEERQRLIKERDEQTAHLTSMEVSFSDLHSKYEKSKQIILSCKANEDIYKKSIKEFQDNFSKMQNNYELLKQHATSKLNHANQELEKMNRAHEAEVLKMNAMIKRKELHITSLEETLAQKTKANEELTAICDELINKVG